MEKPKGWGKAEEVAVSETRFSNVVCGRACWAWRARMAAASLASALLMFEACDEVARVERVVEAKLRAVVAV